MTWRTQFGLNFDGEIAVDLFAGGGGASTGIEMALGRPVDIAINHDPDAVSMHTANHPHADHYVSDVYEVDPVDAVAGRRVGYLHASPDCTHHSQARGGQSRKRAIRSLSWVVHKWAGKIRPRVITLENVEQILQWSPLVAKRCRMTGRVVKIDGSVALPDERVPVARQFLVPDKRRRGHNWRHFIEGLRAMGYAVEWRNLRACDYGAPTTRTRLYMIARCDGQPIAWPAPTHHASPKRGQKRWRAAAECIDWSVPGKSIFDRKKPLADATMRRIARGIDRFVLNNNDPFIVPATHAGNDRVHDIREPMRTVTAAHRGELMLASSVMIQAGHGEGRPGGVQRWGRGCKSANDPLNTVTASGSGGHSIATAYMAQMNGGFNGTPGHDLRRPTSTVTNRGSQQQLVTAHLMTQRHNSTGSSTSQPLPTITAGGQHHGLVECRLSTEEETGALHVAAFLINYYGNGAPRDLQAPVDTVTTKDRLALVTVRINGLPWVIIDIRLRMLLPRELYRAQGFPDDYRIEQGHDGRRFSKSAQVRFCGNSVSPLPMIAIYRTLDTPATAVARGAA